jgi:hypothetical protein
MFPVTFNVPDVKTTNASLLSVPPELVNNKLLQLNVPVFRAMLLAKSLEVLFTFTLPVTFKLNAPKVRAVAFAPGSIVKAPILLAGETFNVTLWLFRIVTVPVPALCPG